MRIKTSVWSAALVCSSVLPVLAEAGVIIGVAPLPPPAPRVEVIPVVPAPGYVWRPGFWAWNGTTYIWTAGHYVVAPRPAAVWVPGHWVARRGGWVWTAGYWRR